MTQPIEDEEFLHGLQNENPEVRWRTALHLKSWADSRSAELLKTALATDASPKVRWVAALSLGFRGAEGREAGMFEPLAGALSDEAPEVREKAAIWLGRLKDSRAFEPLMGAMNDKSGAVRAAVGDEGVVDALIELTQEEDNMVRAEAEKALQRLESRGTSVGSKPNQT